MASSSSLQKLACAVLMCMVVLAPYAEAGITCGVVSSNLAACIPYLTSGGRAAPPRCCAGIRALKNMASSPADRRTACGCLKSASGSIRNLNYGKAAGLPRSCGVNIPFPISPRTDCSRVN